MIPLSLRLHNFMSYGEDTPPLDFSRFTTACLTGDNGHGKSTLLDAITWALWGETRAKSLDDVVRLGQDEAEVEFIFDLESERYRVLRKRSLKTRQSALELQGFDQATQRYRPLSGASIRETEAKIVQLLHMNYDTFINSVFVLQGRADEFTTRRPGERKRILADILGLSVYDALEARARAHRNEMDLEVKTLLQRLAELQQDVERKEELAAAVSAQQDALAHLQVELQSAQQPWSSCASVRMPWNCRANVPHDVARRLQQVQHELLEVDQQLTVHQRRMADYDAILQQESTILAGYQALQQLREQEHVYSTQAEEYATLQQRQTALQQAITTEQYRLELEQRSAYQRQQELARRKSSTSETFLQQAPRIAAAYSALQEARQRDAAMAQTLQRAVHPGAGQKPGGVPHAAEAPYARAGTALPARSPARLATQRGGAAVLAAASRRPPAATDRDRAPYETPRADTHGRCRHQGATGNQPSRRRRRRCRRRSTSRRKNVSCWRLQERTARYAKKP